MIRKSEPSSRRLTPSRRNLLRFGVPAVVLAGAGVATTVAANAEDLGLPFFGPSREELEADLKTRIDAYLADTGTQVEASVAIERGERRLDYNPGQTHITASIVKVELLAMVQEYWGAVDAIPEEHRELLHLMITESKNRAATTLYNYLGGVDALVAAHARYGLQDTTPDAEGRWGVGWSSAPDQLALTDLALFTARGVLDAEQVDLSRELMGGVTEEQVWGVSAAAAEDETVWLKNGWDVESQLDGRWVVNSIGVLGGTGDEPVKMAVLTSGAVDDVEGVPIVEAIARIAREVVETE